MIVKGHVELVVLLRDFVLILCESDRFDGEESLAASEFHDFADDHFNLPLELCYFF